MMTMSSAIRGRQGLLGAAGLLALLASNGLAAEGPSWRIERGDVRILVPLKPGGAFTATTPSLAGTLTLEGTKPARLAGEVSMDLSTIDTGISLRNQHLRENYLDVAKGEGFNKAVLSDIHLSEVGGEAFDGTTPFTSSLDPTPTPRYSGGVTAKSVRTSGNSARTRRNTSGSGWDPSCS